MIRKALIVVLTIASLWTLLSLGMSFAPRSGAAWFRYGSVEHGKQITWHVYEGASRVDSRTYDNMGRNVSRRSYTPPPIWVFLLMLVAYPAVAFTCGPFRRWWRRSIGRCVVCGTAIVGSIKVCSKCGADVACLLKMTSSSWFALTALYAAVMLLAGSALVMVEAYEGAIVFGILALAAPLFGLVVGIAYTRRYNRRYLGWRYCSNCRYDLTGNESGVCPECGTAVGLEPFA